MPRTKPTPLGAPPNRAAAESAVVDYVMDRLRHGGVADQDERVGAAMAIAQAALDLADAQIAARLSGGPERDAAEAARVRRALVAASGNVRAAAAALGVGERGLHKAIGRLGLRGWLTAEYERAARQPNKT
jgi:hypothetical protein